MTTKSTRARRRKKPTSRARLRPTYRRARAAAPIKAERSSSCSSRASPRATLISVPLVGYARIEQRVDQVEDERRQADRNDQDEDDALDQVVVRTADGVEEDGADTGIGEDDLDE